MDDSSSHKAGRQSGSSSVKKMLLRALSLITLGIFMLPAGYGFRPHFQVESTIPSVMLGNEVFCRDFPKELENLRLGLVINHTSRLQDGTPLSQALLKEGADIRAIFVPEHGLEGEEEGGVPLGDDKTLEIPVFSLYGQNNKPQPSQLKDIDVLIYDIQDIGTRFYTYISTLKLVMEAAAEQGIPVYVLDRPNPLGGEEIEGPILEHEFESFIGALPIPIRYGLTCGELALMMKGESWIPPQVDLRIIRMRGWKRSYFWKNTGLSWIPPSPNIPSPESGLFYPGLALLGGVILNHGLGTSLPFQQFGAPWLDTAALEKQLPTEALSGLILHPTTFTPKAIPGKTSSPPYKDRDCLGFRLEITEPAGFLVVRAVLFIIKAVKGIHPDQIYRKPTSLDRMFGNAMLTAFLQDRISFDELLERLEKDQNTFRKKRTPYLIYN